MNSPCTQERCDTCPAKIVCRCLQITEEQITSTITMLGLRSVREVKSYTGAGDGCTCCHKVIREIIEQNDLAPAGV